VSAAVALTTVACGDDDAATPSPDADVVVIARDNVFDADRYTAEAGDVRFSYVEEGRVPHTLLIEDVSGFKLEVRPSKRLDEGSVELQPGTYTLYCDVPGHRSTMQATLDVT